jgi:isopentenyl-diphosphate delta-isomerase
MNKTESRKDEHVRVSLEKDVSAEHNYWDDIKLVHNALPELDKNKIDLSTSLFNKKIKAPLIIASMTGGYPKAKKINENLAAAAEKYQIGMGVGSQRAAIEKSDLRDTYGVIKDYDIPLRFANIGGSQIVEWGHKKTLENAQKMIDMINADVFIVCLNFLQEIVMSEGESNAEGCLDAIKKLADGLNTPVLVKESGAGISYDVAYRLSQTKVSGIDVGGLSGTSFAAIEHHRAKMKNDKLHARGGKTFWNWGIPTPTSVLEVGDATDWKLPIIATGGIRDGLDAAKALVLGASAAGMAHALLEFATKNKDLVVSEVEAIIKEIRATMFLCGIDKVERMSDVGWTVVGAQLWI